MHTCTAVHVTRWLQHLVFDNHFPRSSSHIRDSTFLNPWKGRFQLPIFQKALSQAEARREDFLKDPEWSYTPEQNLLQTNSSPASGNAWETASLGPKGLQLQGRRAGCWRQQVLGLQGEMRHLVLRLSRGMWDSHSLEFYPIPPALHVG